MNKHTRKLKSDLKGFIALFVAALLLFGAMPAARAIAFDDAQEDNIVEIEGPITSLPDTQDLTGTWTIARIKIIVTTSTKINQERGKAVVGSIVEVKGVKNNDGTISASEIEVKLNPADGTPIKFTGKIEDLPSTPGRVGDWKVSGRLLHVSSATKIDQEKGQIAVGSLVDIQGLVLADGSINALEIDVRPDNTNGIAVKFLGRVEKLPDTRGRIGEWVVSGRTVLVVERTIIKQERSAVMVGSLVDVEGFAQLDGVILASKIEVRANVDNPNIYVDFRGVIEGLPGTTDFVGDWKVSGRLVHVSADTKIDQERGKVAVGAFVEIAGTLQADGSVKALKIAVRENPNPSGYIKFIGVVKSLPITTTSTPTFVGDWKIGEKLVHVSADTKIDQDNGKVAVGALVEVEGVLRNDGSVDAKLIEVKHTSNDTLNYIRFFGTINAVPANNTLVGDWTVGRRTVHVVQRTRIRTEHGAPRVGAYVEVEGNQRSDGTIDAFRIEVERDAGAPDGTIGFINFYGPIKTLPDTKDFIGKWQVGDKTVVVNDKTKIDPRRGKVEVNAYVEVYGYLLADNTVTGIRIEVRPVPTADSARINRSLIEFIGEVRKLPESKNYVGDWVVGGRTVHVRERTVIHRERATVTVGATVEIVGAELSNGEVDAKVIEVEHGPVGASFLAYSPLTSVNAGSYQGENSSSSIIASFGNNLAASTVVANSLPLPTTLGDVSVLVDGQPAGLFFVSPNQINYLVPEGLLPGTAQVTVLRNGNTVAQGSLTIGIVSPSIFTSDSSGQGTPAGVLLRIKANGEQSYEPLARFDAATGKVTPVTITRQAGDRLFLILYGTGLRGVDNVESVQVFVGNTAAKVLYAGPAPGFAGLDQLNIEIPESVSGGNLVIAVKAFDGDGKVLIANRVTISVQ